MNLLLDTHIWIWARLEPWRIASDVNQAMSEPENELWLSPVSIWELVVQIEKRRIRLDEDLSAWIARSKQELMLKEAPVSWEIAQELLFIPFNHRDPADRLLAATARVHDFTLITADERLLQIEGLRVMPNR